MAQSGSAARRYAEALLEVATAENAVPAYLASLDRLRDALPPDVMRWLRDRRVAAGARQLLDAAIASEPRAVRAVVAMLLERDRIAILPEIARAYADLVDRREGIVNAKITTPVELDAIHRSELATRLERVSGKRVRATFAVDPALLGGATIQLGDRLIDTSIRAQLEAMRAQLAS
jgi:F-type H+-transporting ATPase subunit delta